LTKKKSKYFILSSSNIQNVRIRSELYDTLSNYFDDVYFVGDFCCDIDKNQIIWKGAYNRKGLLFEFIIFLRLFLILIRHKPTHIISFAPKNNIYCGILQALFEYKLSTVVSGLGSFSLKLTNRRSLLNYLFRYSVAKSNNVIAMNNDNFIFLSNCFGEKKVFQIASEGLDTNINFDYKKELNEYLYLSRIINEKGIFHIIEAFKISFKFNTNIILNIAGEMSLNENERSIFFNQIIHPGIIYHGEVSESEKIELLKRTSFVLLPSIYGEGLPMILLEAQLYGSIVITTKVPGCLDAISDVMINFCCEYSTDSIQESIKKCINLDKESFIKITNYSRQWVKDIHDNSAICLKYIEIFKHTSFINNK
jgi:glycosyltransferase involved in cell wall biosynthesis